jgi:Zn-finger nucleic acid-binding protein
VTLEDSVNCPIDGQTLLMTERQGVEIDYCPSCRGVWLDRGELDKLVQAVDTDRGRNEPTKSEGKPEEKPKKKKSSFLKDLFEFGQE